MLRSTPEFRYLISTKDQYFLGISVIDDTITFYAATKLGARAEKFATQCNNDYLSLTGASTTHGYDAHHTKVHSTDESEADLPHIHYKHSENQPINRATLNKNLNYFKNCVPQPHGLTQKIIEDIDKQFKQFKVKVLAGELEPDDVYEASNNEIYTQHKMKHSSNRMPSIAQHTECALDDKFSHGCEFSPTSTQWMLPKLIMCGLEEKSSHPPQNISQCAVPISDQPTQSFRSQDVSNFVIGAIGIVTCLVKFGFLNCLTRKCLKKNSDTQLSQVRIIKRS